MAFDLLTDGREDLRAAPLSERRARLERLLGAGRPPILLTLATRDRARAREWLDRHHGAGIDGVMTKPRGDPYPPGRRGGALSRDEPSV